LRLAFPRKAVAGLAVLTVAAAGTFQSTPSSQPAAATGGLELVELGRYITGLADPAEEVSSGEVVAFENGRMYVTNATAARLDIVNVSKQGIPSLFKSVDLSGYGADLTSVAVKNGIVAASLSNDVKTDPGVVILMNASGKILNQVTVGPLPDMLTFSTLGLRLLVANEGEPDDDFLVDPDGSVSIISVIPAIASGWFGWTPAGVVKTATFSDFNVGGPRNGELSDQVRIFGPNNPTVAQGLEPEYISVGPDLRTAYVTLQEANAVAVINILNARVERIIPLGLKDHNQPGNELDPSDRDDGIVIGNWPLFGMYQPDAIDSYRVGAHTYFVTANEGDVREWGDYEEGQRAKDFEDFGLSLDPAIFPNADDLLEDEQLGRLTLSTATGDTDGDGDFEELHVFGARSFSIWRSDGTQVFDSGDDFEQKVADDHPDFFNSDNAEANFDNRSDNKGPEPEAIVLGKVKNRTYAFIGLERQGGVMVYDVTDPANATFVSYVNTRDYSQDAAPDSGPEVLVFVEASQSPTKKPLLLVANEISGTVNVFQVN